MLVNQTINRGMNKNNIKAFSLLFLTEKSQQQKVPTDRSNGLWEFCLYRQKNGRRKAPSGRELAPKATEGERVTMKLS